MKKEKIAVILPSRGLIYAEVMKAVEKFKNEYDLQIFISNGLPIPKAQNSLVLQAFNMGFEFFWFVEEDTVPPDNILDKFFETYNRHNAQIITVDYGMENGQSTIAYFEGTKDIAFCALGCTFVTRKAISKLDFPYFRTDKALRLPSCQWYDIPENSMYGMLDVWFTWNIRESGFKIYQIEGVEAKHLKIDELGDRKKNNGTHVISIKGKSEFNLTV